MVILAPLLKARDAVVGLLGRRVPVTIVGRAPTPRPARYGRQLVSHLGHRVSGSWDPETETGVLDFAPGERAVLTCS